MDPRSTCPRSVAKLVTGAVHAWQCKRVALEPGLAHLGQGIHLKPIQWLLHGRRAGLTSEQAGYLRSAVVGGQWPQARKVEAGLSSGSLRRA